MCNYSPTSASPTSAQGHKKAESNYTSESLIEPRKKIHFKRLSKLPYMKGHDRKVYKLMRVRINSGRAYRNGKTGQYVKPPQSSDAPALIETSAAQSGTDRRCL